MICIVWYGARVMHLLDKWNRGLSLSRISDRKGAFEILAIFYFRGGGF